jgi:hypothetical protein
LATETGIERLFFAAFLQSPEVRNHISEHKISEAARKNRSV